MGFSWGKKKGPLLALTLPRDRAIGSKALRARLVSSFKYTLDYVILQNAVVKRITVYIE